MRYISTKALATIIKNHKRWLDKDGDGWETMKANLSYIDLSNTNLSYADLRCANLSNDDLSYTDLRVINLGNANLSSTNLNGANLRYANLRSANLSYTDLRYANLWNANLSYTDLRDTDLRYVNLRFANLRCADLRGADLRDADLRYANLMGADLRDANLKGVNLEGANLWDVDLRGTNLREANLWSANLRGAKNVPYIPMICPKEGAFIAYKKACNKIVKLLIPKDAKRSSATTRKCRCDRATVLAIYELDGSISTVTEVASNREPNFIYKINKEVIVDDFDDDRWNECSTGIHFFMQRQEAIDYLS